MRALVAALAALLVTAGPAYANDPKVPDEYEPGKAQTMVASVDRVTTSADGRLKCGGVTATTTVRGKFHGKFLYRSYLHGQWCWRGGFVKSVRFTRWGTTASWTPWDYKGVIFTINGGGVNRRYAYQRAGYKFRLCVTWYCTSDAIWTSLTLRGNGTYANDGGRVH